MVGLIQKILLDVVEAQGGPAAVAEIKRRAGVPADQRFRLDTVYPDDECQRLFKAAGEVLGASQQELETLYADYFCRDAVRRWPVWFQISTTARQFLERQPTIHNTFATGVRDAEARRGIQDKFHIEKHEHGLVTHYRSPNDLCGLYMALARWILDYYGDQAEIEETRCTRRGDVECEIHIRWPGSRRA